MSSWIPGSNNFILDDALTSCEYIYHFLIYFRLESKVCPLNINIFLLCVGLITKNFREGKPMDISNTPDDQVRYQMRGYGKYFALAKLTSWETLTSFYRQENDDQESKFAFIFSLLLLVPVLFLLTTHAICI